MDYGLVNAFLALEDLSEHESLLKKNVLSLNEAMQRVSGERARLAQELQKKEQEFLKVSGALENQLSVVEHVAKQKGLEPLQPEVEEKAE
jgi:hypothetical protein